MSLLRIDVLPKSESDKRGAQNLDSTKTAQSKKRGRRPQFPRVRRGRPWGSPLPGLERGDHPVAADPISYMWEAEFGNPQTSVPDTPKRSGLRRFLADRAHPIWSGGEPLRADDDVVGRIRGFRPEEEIPDEVWERIKPVIDQWVELAEPQSSYVAAQLLTPLSQCVWFCEKRGIGIGAEAVLDPATIDFFVNNGLPDRSDGTRLNYRTQLFSVGRAVLGQPTYPLRPLGMRGSMPATPYSVAQIRDIHGWRRGLPTHAMRSGVDALLTLAHGAGLTSEEILRIVGSEIEQTSMGVVVHVTGRKPRDVVVTASYEDAALRIAELVGDRPMFQPGREKIRGKAISRFVDRLPQGGAPRVSPLRLRVTWMVDHLSRRVPAGLLAAAAGVEAQQVVKYLDYVPPLDPTDAARLLRGEVMD